MNSTQLVKSSQPSTRTAAAANEVLPAKEQQQQADTKDSMPQVFIQRKLSIGAPDDPLEKEADSMADKVMRMPMPEPISFSSAKNSVHRKCTHCEEEEKDLQRKESNNDSTSIAPPIVHDVLNSSDGKPLDPDTRSFMEPRFNYDFSNVKVHNNDIAAKSATSVNALAYTSGNNIVFNSGQYDTDSPSGKRLLAHELTHVIQQGNNVQKKIMRVAKKVGPNQVDVDLPTGGVCHVTRVFEPRKGSGKIPKPPEVGGSIDMQNITLYFRWCKGQTKGGVTLGADIPAQAIDVSQKILDALTSGRGADGVSDVLQGANIHPFIEFVIAKSGSFSLTANGEITVGSDGVTGGKGGLTIGAGKVKGKIGVSKQGDLPTTIDIGIEVTEGTPKFDCPVIEVPLKSKLVCECPGPENKGKITLKSFPVTQTEFIYFDYAVDKINDKLSAKRIARLEVLLRDGYKVKSVQGFTSPEGTIDKGPGFEGNKELGDKRAKAALKELQKICGRILMSLENIGKCADDALTGIKPLGQGELYGSVIDPESPDKEPKELKGKELESHVIEKFNEENKEAPHRTEEFTETLKGKKPAEQAALIYPLLRRAEIILEREGRPFDIDVKLPSVPVQCPADVEDQARIQFLLM